MAATLKDIKRARKDIRYYEPNTAFPERKEFHDVCRKLLDNKPIVKTKTS
jgi:hypothetical protein